MQKAPDRDWGGLITEIVFWRVGDFMFVCLWRAGIRSKAKGGREKMSLPRLSPTKFNTQDGGQKFRQL